MSSPRDGVDLLGRLLRSHWRCLALQEGAPPESTPIVSTARLEVYSSEGYAMMTRDRPRNAVYLAAIQQAVSAGALEFLEVGCGGDACLTRMVLAQPGARVTALEGNVSAATAAAVLLCAAAVPEARYTIHASLSTAQELAPFFEAARRSRGVHAVLQEVLGYIASREGVVPVFRDLHARLGAGWWSALPSHAATFFTPTHVTISAVRHNLTHAQSLLGSVGGHPVRCARGAPPFSPPGDGGAAGGASAAAATAAAHSAPFFLVSRLPMREDVCPFWEAGSGPAGYGLPRCGALEFLSLSEDLAPQLVQERTTVFVAGRGRVTVNSLSCFIWAGFEPRAPPTPAPAPASAGGGGIGSPPATRRRGAALPKARAKDEEEEVQGAEEREEGGPVATPPRLSTRSAGPRDPGPGGGTGFPYHAPGLPPLRPRTLAFSSSQADTPDLVANNWPNLVLLLEEPVVLEKGQAMEVQSLADLSVDPHIYSA